MTSEGERLASRGGAPPSGVRGYTRLLLAAALALAIGTFAWFGPLSDVLGWTAVLVAGVVIGLIAAVTPGVHWPLMVAFAVRAASVLLHTYVTPLPGSELDAMTFERFGWEWSHGTFRDVLGRFVSGAYLYSWMIAVLYWVAGRSQLMVAVVNVLFGTLVVLNVFKITTLIADERAARRAAWAAALFPTLVLYSALTMREVAVTYPLTLGVLCLAHWRDTHHPRWALFAMLAFAAAIAFHVVVVGVIAFALLGIGVNWLASLARGKVVTSLKALTGLALAAAIVVVVVRSGWGNLNYVARLSLSAVRFQQEVAAVERTAYLQGFTTTSPVDLLWQTPIRLTFFLFVPFPWWVRTPLDVFGLLDSVLYAWLIWNVGRGARYLWRNPVSRIVLLPLAGCVVTFALVVSNYGTAIRHRGKAAPLLIALAFAAREHRRHGGAAQPGIVMRPVRA